MAFKLIVLLIFIKIIICEVWIPDESELQNNKITILSQFNSEIQAMTNVSYYCYAKFDCMVRDCQNQLAFIHWMLPRELRENELLYGVNSSRIEFSRQSISWFNDNTTFLIRSTMYIKDIGLIQKGTYSCSLSINDDLVSKESFDISVKGIERHAVITIMLNIKLIYFLRK